MNRRSVTIEMEVSVTVDETKFTEEWMAEFREGFFPFMTIEDHIRHLGQLYARGIVSGFSDEFIEGYGPVKEMGIRFHDGPIDAYVCSNVQVVDERGHVIE